MQAVQVHVKCAIVNHSNASACSLRMQRKLDSVAPLPVQWNLESECKLLIAALQIAFPSAVEKSVVPAEATDAGDSANVT